jgi:hypothetical protein
MCDFSILSVHVVVRNNRYARLKRELNLTADELLSLVWLSAIQATAAPQVRTVASVLISLLLRRLLCLADGQRAAAIAAVQRRADGRHGDQHADANRRPQEVKQTVDAHYKRNFCLYFRSIAIVLLLCCSGDQKNAPICCCCCCFMLRPPKTQFRNVNPNDNTRHRSAEKGTNDERSIISPLAVAHRRATTH